MNAQVATMNPLSHSSSLFFVVSLFLSLSSVICDGLVIKDGLKRFRELQLPNNVVGPESLAFDCHGRGPYVGVADGRILKWKGARKGLTEFAFNSPKWEKKLCDGSTNYTIEAICGRPLGLKFDPKTCNLYIADAYYGILVVGQHGGVAKQLAISADDGVPFKFLNGLDVDSQTGAVYFSESSSKYQLRDAAKITAADNSGRLLRYDPGTKSMKPWHHAHGF
ncbi:hypothetical protein L6164_026959 [Bauhinia variegata]|uniref:Uncharacterized protein n=1 Tax=Bauhinia variegata TaxID=167791 RepID=A0ACB9LS12_BAUVA|nr:hypothetical protein L6164_026959 [Bauhinia variegata]